MFHATAILTFLLSLSAGAFFDLEIPAQKASIKTVGTKTDEGWNLWSNGYLGDWIKFDKKGKYTVTIKAKGEKAAGEWPAMELFADTVSVKRWCVEKAEFTDYSAEIELEGGVHQLLVAFRNDFNAQGEDRNLHIASIRITPPEGIKDPSAASEPNWREEADKRIEAMRKGELTIKICDGEGKPIKGAKVAVRLSKHEFKFGTCLNTRFFGERTDNDAAKKYRETLRKYFNCAVFENAFKWPAMEPTSGMPFYVRVDAALKWCTEKRIPVRGHCIFWANEKRVPKWAREFDDDGLREAIDRRIKRDLGRYRGKITEYDVNNEMIAHDYFEKRLGPEIRAHMFKLAHETDAGARLFANDYNILNGAAIDKYEKQIESLLKAGAPVGGIGCQGHFGEKMPSPATMKFLFDRLARFKLPILVTEFDINTRDEEIKAKQLADFYRLAFSHPAVEGVLMWGFWEGSHWRPAAAIFNRDFTPRPAADAYRKLVFEEWRSREDGVTGEDGTFKCRVFYGSYGLTVTTEGLPKCYQTTFTSVEKDKTVTINLK